MAACRSSAPIPGTSRGRAERMARISGVDIPREKRLVVSLTYIFGIGDTTAQQVCEGTGIDPNTRVRDLTDEEAARLRGFVEQNYKVEGDLRRDVAEDI